MQFKGLEFRVDGKKEPPERIPMRESKFQGREIGSRVEDGLGIGNQDSGDPWGYRPTQLREPQLGLRRLPFKGSPSHYPGGFRV